MRKAAGYYYYGHFRNRSLDTTPYGCKLEISFQVQKSVKIFVCRIQPILKQRQKFDVSNRWDEQTRGRPRLGSGWRGCIHLNSSRRGPLPNAHGALLTAPKRGGRIKATCCCSCELPELLLLPLLLLHHRNYPDASHRGSGYLFPTSRKSRSPSTTSNPSTPSTPSLSLPRPSVLFTRCYLAPKLRCSLCYHHGEHHATLPYHRSRVAGRRQPKLRPSSKVGCPNKLFTPPGFPRRP